MTHVKIIQSACHVRNTREKLVYKLRIIFLKVACPLLFKKDESWQPNAQFQLLPKIGRLDNSHWLMYFRIVYKMANQKPKKMSIRFSKPNIFCIRATMLFKMQRSIYINCNDPEKSASYIYAITPKRLVNLKLSLESLIKSSFTQ